MVHIGLMVRLQRYSSFLIDCGLWGEGEFLKHFLAYCTKYDEINMRHSDGQKHVSYKNGINNFFVCLFLHVHTQVFRYIAAYKGKCFAA